ncbi:MAG TPA: PilN domain-containing protein [bacterium]|nr:PilN domain-containing protein [bacterium]
MITINLLASERRRAGPAPAGGKLWIGATVAVVGILLVWSFLLIHRSGQLQAQINDVAHQTDALRPVALQVQQLSQEAAALQGEEAVVRQLLAFEMPAAESLQTIQAVIPSNVWLTSMATSGANLATFDGYAFSYPEVARFMVQLGASGSFENVDLSSTNADSIGDRNVVRFEVVGTLSAHPVTSQAQQGVTR